jgi:site-specific DNA recombinase
MLQSRKGDRIMAYYGYIRVSTETQAEKGYGLEAQRTEIEKYCAANKITLAKMYQDAGISGAAKATDGDEEAIGKRTGLLEMLAALQKDDTVIVLNTSRLWRAIIVQGIITRDVMRREARIFSIEQPGFDIYKMNTDPNAFLINTILGALDQWDRMNIALKLARGRTVKATGGNKPAGAIPYGYRYANDKKGVDVVEAEAATVKRMFCAAQAGNSLRKIADMLNSEGTSTRSGKLWSAAGIQLILRNDFYTGILTHAGKKIPGRQPQIISKVQFGKVAAQLKSRQKV